MSKVLIVECSRPLKASWILLMLRITERRLGWVHFDTIRVQKITASSAIIDVGPDVQTVRRLRRAPLREQ